MQASASAHACHFYPIAKIFCLIITLGSNLVLDLRREATGRALLKWVTVVGGGKRLHLARGVRALSFQPQGEDACQILRDGFPGQLRGAGRAGGAWAPNLTGSRRATGLPWSPALTASTFPRSLWGLVHQPDKWRPPAPASSMRGGALTPVRGPNPCPALLPAMPGRGSRPSEPD